MPPIATTGTSTDAAEAPQPLDVRGAAGHRASWGWQKPGLPRCNPPRPPRPSALRPRFPRTRRGSCLCPMSRRAREAGMSSWPTWTPSASTARATSMPVVDDERDAGRPAEPAERSRLLDHAPRRGAASAGTGRWSPRRGWRPARWRAGCARGKAPASVTRYSEICRRRAPRPWSAHGYARSTTRTPFVDPGGCQVVQLVQERSAEGARPAGARVPRAPRQDRSRRARMRRRSACQVPRRRRWRPPSLPCSPCR